MNNVTRRGRGQQISAFLASRRTHRRHRGARRPVARHPRPQHAAPGNDSVQRFAWYVGLALMAALEVIDWPVAIVIGIGHEFGHRARTRAIRELAGGMEAAGSTALAS
jgi:hypothetical protein